ncbi:hypothetical protein [Dyadobacter bucti]|uniref:hypothetical protein n=1 Tax=Dyadobacter bucti TaxID=2572203 RepID=UPI0011092C64|nr:hypothetical protein [Dyadobacter bucti]
MSVIRTLLILVFFTSTTSYGQMVHPMLRFSQMDWIETKEAFLIRIDLKYTYEESNFRKKIHLLDSTINVLRHQNIDYSIQESELKSLKKELAGLKISRDEEIKSVGKLCDPFILELQTTAFYSKPDYEGKEFVVTGNVKSASLPFSPKSVRVAQGCKLSVWPYENYRKHRDYRDVKFNDSTSSDLPDNVATGSMMGDRYIFRAESWKLRCKKN